VAVQPPGDTRSGDSVDARAGGTLDAGAASFDDRDLPLDSHLHTDQSPDSDVPIDAYCAAAVARSIPELMITDHVDFDPRDRAYAFTTFADRERVVRAAAERWADRGLTLRFGAELTYRRRHEDDIRSHLRRHRYDYTIGSVHADPDSEYTAARVTSWVQGRSLPEIVAPYFDEVVAAARSAIFDSLGHLDFVKRYLVPHVSPEQLAAAPELYEPILQCLVDSGTGLEINTSGLRQPPGETYPAPWVVARFRDLGGTRITVGSDAHRRDHVAFGLGRGYRTAAQAGFQGIEPWRSSKSLRYAVPDRFRLDA
jgi:histidinol-phosphatase (PHP family)